MIKNFVFDLDGTLLNYKNGYNLEFSEVYKFFEELKKSGNFLHINSARAYDRIMDHYNNLNFNGCVIAEAGCAFFRPVSSVPEFEQAELDFSLLERIVNEKLSFKRVNIDDVFSDPSAFATKYISGNYCFGGDSNKYTSAILFRNIQNSELSNAQDICSLVEGSIKENFSGFDVFYLDDICALIIKPAGITKENYMNLIKRPCASFGDTSSDLPMLKVSEFCGCPVNSTQSVKDYVLSCGKKGFVSEYEYTLGIMDCVNHFKKGV